MSTTTSPPPQAGLVGFNNQTAFDPYLPSSPDEEQLTQVSTSHNTPGSSFHPESHQSLESATDRANFLSAGSVSGTGESPYPDYATHASNGMSPADFGGEFPGLDGYGVQEYDDNLLLEGFYGDLPVPENPQDNSFFMPSVGPTGLSQSDEPLSATTNTTNTFSRRSTGLANLSKDLPSPVLTEMASPESVAEGPGPMHKNQLLGGGPMSRISSQSTTVDASHLHGQNYSQPTPAATRSSVEASPNPSGDNRFSAPSFRVELHTRGDSPARAGGAKRSRAGSRSSSHLAAPHQDSEDRDNEETYDSTTKGGRRGIGPSDREKMNDTAAMNVEDIEQQQKLAVKSGQIGQWLSTSEANTVPPDEIPLPVPDEFLKPANRRIRSKSSSGPRDLQTEAFDFSKGIRAGIEAKIPGPGRLIDEESDEEYDDDDYGSSAGAAPESVEMNAEHSEEADRFPAFDPNGRKAPEASPWGDPIYFPSHPGAVEQPNTSNAAMMRFVRRAKDIETASRVATWGTIPRRMSDGDMQRVFGDNGLLSRLSISKEKQREGSDDDNWRQFKDSVEQAAAKFLPKRTLSSARRKQSDAPRPGSKDSQVPEHGRKESVVKRKDSSHSSHERHGSLGNSSLINRLPSVRKRPKSPGLNTNIAAGIANAAQVASGPVGVKGPRSPSSITSPVGAWDSIKNAARGKLSRHSSQDAQEFKTDCRTQSANQSRTSLISPPNDALPTSAPAPQAIDEEDADSDEVAPEDTKAVKMDMKPSEDRIIPNFEGFKANVRSANPRLPSWLVDRLGLEQVRRYKKLVNFKVEHAKAFETGSCGSGAYCKDRGGEPTYFPAKATQKEPVHSHTGFSLSTGAEDDEDAEVAADGLVTEAQFPQGLPMPPAKRLPAEFECPLCFQVKKFQKPSDWSKHVHEDLQPFTCTFYNCPDPKSFKRKADWVRHENERHRQLEWWQCTEEGCQHLCYRRDNFVQHLVREHKLPEPKSKSAKPNKPAVRGPAKGKVKAPRGDMSSVPLEDKVLYMVDVCRHETPKNAIDEPCRFCGNVCNSFKKLTVHLARHMENLSLPVLRLVEQKDVTPDTIISPIENKLPQASISPSEQTQLAHNQGFHQQSVLPGFTPVVSEAQFQPNYAAQAGWNQQNPQVSQHGGNSNFNTGMDGWIPSDNIYATTGQSHYSTMAMHHNSVPNPAMYNMSTQANSMPTQYQNYGTAIPAQQRPHFSTPQYMSQGQGRMNHGVPTSQAHQNGMLPLQYDSRGANAYSQGQNAAALYNAERMQQQRRSPPQAGQPFYNNY
ncbi:MAG: hypothetical protein MMC23_002886 [Stictis urceolatum]|nr:hypothetical protein [Stictis urceolata]